MSGYDPVAGTEALNRALTADKMLWATDTTAPGTDGHRRARDRAVLESLNSGLSLEFVADKLGVQIDDVERMGASARGKLHRA